MVIILHRYKFVKTLINTLTGTLLFSIAHTSVQAAATVQSASLANELGIRSIEEAFAVATLMSDSDALTFGFMNFDLEVNGEEIGDEESNNFKNSLNVIVVPYTWDLEPRSEAWDHSITVRAFYINIERDNEIVTGIKDNLNESTYGVYGNYAQLYHVTDNWYVESALGLHLSYYENNYKYGSAPDDLDPDLDWDDIQNELNGSVFNVSTFAGIIEAEVGIGYEREEQWGSWRAHNNTNYIYGHGLGGSIDDPGSINPEGWRLTNGVEFTVEIPELWGARDFLTIDFKRIDVMGDLERMAESGNYYETTFGWIVDTNKKIPMLDNIGIGISINYGSSLSGGTLVLYYNEE